MYKKYDVKLLYGASIISNQLIRISNILLSFAI
jgi:hypothetical protein